MSILNESTVREKLRRFITAELMRDDSYELGDDEPIFTGGLIGSLEMVQIQIYIEDVFGLLVPDPEMTVARMNTLDQMVTRVLRDQK